MKKQGQTARKYLQNICLIKDLYPKHSKSKIRKQTVQLKKMEEIFQQTPHQRWQINM